MGDEKKEIKTPIPPAPPLKQIKEGHDPERRDRIYGR